MRVGVEAFVVLAAVLFSLNQQKLYQATAQVFLSSQNLAAQLTGTQSTGINLQPDRIAQTQADVARVPQLAQRVLRSVPGAGLTPEQLLLDSSVSTTANADILTFSVTNHDPALARQLVNAYAAAYTVYRRQLDTAPIARALANVRLLDPGLNEGWTLAATIEDARGDCDAEARTRAAWKALPWWVHFLNLTHPTAASTRRFLQSQTLMRSRDRPPMKRRPRHSDGRTTAADVRD